MQSVVRKESFNSVTVFWLDVELVRKRLSAAVERLADDQNVLRVVLFGSFAEGRAIPGSDLDIMIVLAHDERPLLERISADRMYFSGIGIGVDLFPYRSYAVRSREKLERILWLADILRDG